MNAVAIVSALLLVTLAYHVLLQWRRIAAPARRFEPAPQSAAATLRRAGIDVAVRAVVDVSSVALVVADPRLLAATVAACCGPGAAIGVAYGVHPRQRVDIFAPRVPRLTAAPARPVVLLVHGGAWAFGGRLSTAAFARGLADAVGAVVVSVGHRTYPLGNAEEMIEDVAAAVTWVVSDAGSRVVRALGGEPTRVHLVGHSSGAHLVLSAVLAFALAGTGGQPANERCAASGRADEQLPPASPQPPPPLRGIRAVAAALRPQQAPPAAPAQYGRPPLDVLRRVASVTGVCGPYDIAAHFAREAARATGVPAWSRLPSRVSDVSPMAPAMGGPPHFDAHSPTVLVAGWAASLREGAAALARGRRGRADQNPDGRRATRAGTGAGAVVAAQAAAAAAATDAAAALAALPRVVLLHGECDAVVPVSSSSRLRDAFVAAAAARAAWVECCTAAASGGHSRQRSSSLRSAAGARSLSAAAREASGTSVTLRVVRGLGHADAVIALMLPLPLTAAPPAPAAPVRPTGYHGEGAAGSAWAAGQLASVVAEQLYLEALK